MRNVMGPLLPECESCAGKGTLTAWGGPSKGSELTCGSCSGSGKEPTVFAFDAEMAEPQLWDGGYPSYDPDEYARAALTVLQRGSWLVEDVTWPDDPEEPREGELDRETVRSVVRALEGIGDLGLDETDTYRFALLWALRAAGVVQAVPGLDDQLRGWRQWEEEEHVGEVLEFLPPLPEDEPTL